MKEKLNYSEFVTLCKNLERIGLTEAEKEKIIESRKVFEAIIKSNPKTAYYGINTGVGFLLKKRIPKSRQGEFQENIVMSHACGVGEPLDKELTRGIMLHMILNLKKGCSAIKLETLRLLMEIFNKNLVPVVPMKGSVGASGDLIPQAHIALCLTGRGRIWHQEFIWPSEQILQVFGLKPVKLETGEAIALLNGTSFMTSILAFSVFQADNLIQTSDIAVALTSKALEGYQSLQSAYSLRCVPQVHGTVCDIWRNTKDTVEKKINDFSGNPVILVKEEKIFQGSGNFHGQSLSQAADNLSIALSTLANISERRIERLLNPHFSKLPPFLAKNGGLNTGLMIAQYAAAALVSENKTLAHPASVDSIPVSAGQEDFVSMGGWAARKCWEICKNAEYVIAIEILCSVQALDCKKPLPEDPKIRKIHKIIRSRIPYIEKDREFGEDIERLRDFIRSGEFLKEVENEEDGSTHSTCSGSS